MAPKEKRITVESLVEGSVDESAVKGLSFEEGLKLLEELVEQVESGTLPLERAITAYERGSLVVAQLKKALEGAEERIRVVNKSMTPEAAEGTKG